MRIISKTWTRPILIVGALAVAGALAACGGAYPPVQREAAAAVHGGDRGLECDYLPYPACDGWRAGGTAGGWGGHFDADRDLKIGCAAWHVKHAADLKAAGLASWNAYAAKYGKPNDGSCDLDVASAPAALAAETAPRGATVLPGPGVPSAPPSALGVTGH